MHALITLVELAVLAALVALIWWELHRHRDQIVDALLNPPRVERTAAEACAELLEGAATGLLVAVFVVGALVLA